GPPARLRELPGLTGRPPLAIGDTLPEGQVGFLRIRGKSSVVSSPPPIPHVTEDNVYRCNHYQSYRRPGAAVATPGIAVPVPAAGAATPVLGRPAPGRLVPGRLVPGRLVPGRLVRGWPVAGWPVTGGRSGHGPSLDRPVAGLVRPAGNPP